MLVLLSEMVTLTVSSFKANSSGEGRKSFSNLTFPIGSSEYDIFCFIYFLSLSPIAGADNSDYVFSIGKSDSHNTSGNIAKTIISLLTTTMFQIF
jgi:hypothetical protein